MAMVLSRISLGIEKLRRFKDIIFSNRYLLYTNVGISVSLSAVGDIAEQSYIINSGHQKEWNSMRTQHMSISGLTVGVLCHHWYNFLDRRFPQRTLKIVIKKVLYDQIIFSPINIAVFFLTIGMLEGLNSKEIFKEFCAKGKLLYAAEWTIWPPAQVINFYWLPTKYRVLYDNTISLGYDVFVSYVKHDRDIS
ncbi:hypothetical protein O3M35_011228 [Rhynocoris fuscipes]|uniref:Mpv17-like protein 2 n=1 Tax=Rhynocoris fuscipes TaxID=488301 RepID=A0AAW1D1K4_9HEMI